MFSFKAIALLAAAFTIGAECSAAPSVAAAPLLSGHIGYAHAVPQNIPPYAAQVNVESRALSPLVAAPIAPVAALTAPLAAPFAAPVTARLAAPLAAQFAGPLAAPLASPFAAPIAGPAPYIAGPLPAPYASYPTAPYGGPAAYSATFPYSAPLLRSPYGYAPAYLR